jgi:TolA-binding protein
MNKTIKTMLLLLLAITAVIAMTSCGQGVSQEIYDSAIQQLNEAEGQLSTLQDQLANAKIVELQYNELNKKFEELEKKYNEKMSELGPAEAGCEELQAEFDALKGQNTVTANELAILEAKYEELEAAYKALTAPPEVITEDKVEQALFFLINQDRVNHGLSELAWGKNMAGLAEQNSRRMEELGRYEYSEWAYMQEIFWAVGYSTVDEVANAAMRVWQSNQYRYEHGLLSKAISYCAIGAYKSKGIIYLTFMASDWP